MDIDLGHIDTGSLPRSAATMFALTTHVDERGSLAVADGLPFNPARYFVLTGVPEGSRRGGHAHRTCAEILTCVTGRCVVDVDDGDHRATYVLDRADLALHLPPMVWSSQRDFATGTVVVVLASEPYDAAGYLHHHGSYLEAKAAI